MLLSVIIPVYNVEQTLDRCVESVLGQDVPDMEVVLVNDGSPDNCPQMCISWRQKDSRIKVVHKKNGGLSDARNAGLDIVRGEYITFVDSDDYLLPDTYLPLMSCLKKYPDVDMLEYMVRQDDSKRQTMSLNDEVFCSADEYWLKTKAWTHAYAVNKIYKRNLFNGCRYAKGRTFEDLLLLPLLLKHCQKIATVSYGTYVYTINTDGISKQVTLNSIFSLFRAEVMSAWRMKTLPWNKYGRSLYYYICCRIYDILRLSLGIKL